MAATHKTAKSLARSAAWRWWIGGVAAAVLLICTGLFLGDALWNSIHPEPPERAERNRDGDGEQAGQKKQPIAVDNANKNPKPAAPKTLVSRLIQCDLRLAQGGSPQARIEALSDLAANLQSETFSLVHAAPGKNLEQLAWLYQKVVRDGVVSRCRNLPLGERRKVLPSIVKEFTRVEREASRLARQKPASAKTLRIIASAARAGKGQLRQILERKS